MEKDINTEVSNTQLPATEEKANLKESLRIQKSQWIKEQIKRQREAEDAVLEQMIEEQRVIDGLNSDINENLDRTRESSLHNIFTSLFLHLSCASSAPSTPVHAIINRQICDSKP